MSSDDEPRYADERDGWNPKGGRLSSSDDGRTVAVPLTQEQARDLIIADIHRRECGCDDRSNDCAHWYVASIWLNAMLSASPEVLAAAMGGELHRVSTLPLTVAASRSPRDVIVLPSREVSRGD